MFVVWCVYSIVVSLCVPCFVWCIDVCMHLCFAYLCIYVFFFISSVIICVIMIRNVLIVCFSRSVYLFCCSDVFSVLRYFNVFIVVCVVVLCLYVFVLNVSIFSLFVWMCLLFPASCVWFVFYFPCVCHVSQSAHCCWFVSGWCVLFVFNVLVRFMLFNELYGLLCCCYLLCFVCSR